MHIRTYSAVTTGINCLKAMVKSMCTNSDSVNNKLSISEMAQIHDISRQTLIYYDKIHLFKPEFTDEKTGYRYYSTRQIPFLREICFLRSIGMPLENIRKYTDSNASLSTIQLLNQHKDKIYDEISRLQAQLKKIERRVRIYCDAADYANTDYKPTIQYFPERKVLYYEWDESDRTRHGLHYALMKIWNEVEKYGILPSKHYGAFFFKEELEKGTPLNHAGECCLFHHSIPNLPGLQILKAGQYVCMPRYGMPYDMEPLHKLVRWVHDNGYEIAGNIYDECLLDSVFYDNDCELDFCNLQIPIRERSSLS